MPSLTHTEGSALSIRNLSQCKSGQLVRTRKTDPSIFILVAPDDVYLVGTGQQAVCMLGTNIETGEPVLYDHQVIILPEGDKITISNGDPT